MKNEKINIVSNIFEIWSKILKLYLNIKKYFIIKYLSLKNIFKFYISIIYFLNRNTIGQDYHLYEHILDNGKTMNINFWDTVNYKIYLIISNVNNYFIIINTLLIIKKIINYNTFSLIN